MDSRLRILLVEDNEGDAVLVNDYLAAAGPDKFVVSRARTLHEAHELLGSAAPQLILLDLNLPDSKGMDTLDNICTVAPRGEGSPPIVVLTSYDDQEMADRAIAGCAQDYLVKNDIDARVLIRAIRFAISRHGRDETDRMLADPDKADGNTREAMEVLQRVNRTAIGQSTVDRRPRPTHLDHHQSAGMMLEHFATGSKATEIILAGFSQRLGRLEDYASADQIREARREQLMDQMNRLMVGNGKGPLSSRICRIEEALVNQAAERKDRQNVRTQWLVGLVILFLGWVVSVIAWVYSHFLG